MNETLLREVFDFVEAEAEAEDCHWNQGYWGRQRMDDADTEECHLDTARFGPEDVEVVVPNCGTSMCFAGWATQIGDPNSRFILETENGGLERVLRGDGQVQYISSAAIELLDISTEQANALFDSDNTLEHLRDTLTEWGVLQA